MRLVAPIGEGGTLALSHSRTLALSHSRTLALSHSRTLALSHSRTSALQNLMLVNFVSSEFTAEIFPNQIPSFYCKIDPSLECVEFGRPGFYLSRCSERKTESRVR